MIDQHIREATCRISCDEELGTGWLIADGWVITARHCVLANLSHGKPVELLFSAKSIVVAKVIAESEEYDVCLLSLEDSASAEPLPVRLQHPREGESWQTFGYPKSKATLGHRLTGSIAQILETPQLRVDLDLSVDPPTAMPSYNGLSGAPLVCEGAAVGLIRLKVGHSLAALSLHHLEQFLTSNGVSLPSNPRPPTEPPLADRSDFSKVFDEAVASRGGAYLFLEGAHGYGKSTFCTHFRSNNAAFLNLGAYHLSEPDSALGADYRAQPQVFFDWLATAISVRITGKQPQKKEKSYHELIIQVAEYLKKLSQFCEKSNRFGLFFIDGLNEVSAGPLLGQLVGLLPTKLPPRLTVVLTAPNFTSIATVLAGRVKTGDVLALPPLPNSACYDYCHRVLKPQRRSPGLIKRICEKANGHPLYLRYLTEYANEQTSDDLLDDFPVLTGSIEQYYQSIWIKILPDGDAVNLLALMARMRWGVSLEDFAKALSQTEQAQFVSVIGRIRHLLTDEDYTAIYHTSFAAFIIDQTTSIDKVAYRRLAEFCRDEMQLPYCILNRVFHMVRAGDNSVFADCNQDWVDDAVTMGAEPDALISDVDAVVKRAAVEAPPDEFFRLTLLAQRISFRYDTLFAQSARLIAEALITLGRPLDALQHVLRLDTLIVGPEDALQICFLLHHFGYSSAALTLLERVQQRIIETTENPLTLDHFLWLCSLLFRTVALIRLASDGSGARPFIAVMEMARHACEHSLKDDPAEIEVHMRSIVSESTTYFLSFRDEYAELARIKQQVREIPSHVLPTLCIALLKFEDSVDGYHLPKNRDVLPKFFADLGELASNGEIEPPLAAAVTDTMIRFGAPTKVVELLGAKGGKQPIRPLQLREKNGVDPNHRDLQECGCLWRVAAFLDSDFNCPTLGLFLRTGWEDGLVRLIGALYWCDGRARRAKADGDEMARLACRDQLRSQVLDQLRFTLEQRLLWRDSYGIPENVLPGVYRQLTELLNDCFPEELPNWLEDLVNRAGGQWGMYSEGYRAACFHVANELTREKPTGVVSDGVFRLLQAWRDHVLRGVENRHELVPEILRMIPVFVVVGANEEAERLYTNLLSVSMGPTWYKEDQLGLMTDVVKNVLTSKDVLQRLPQIAGYLERADGEMTFQRYVRNQKATLLGQVARYGRYRAAAAYFRRQCCGSTEELWAEAQHGPIDKIGPLQGSRYPGGAIDDQDAILSLVQGCDLVRWPLRWALLEIFHCGDGRYLTDYATAFAKIANEAGPLPELVRRITILANSETPEAQRLSFTLAFRDALKSEFHTDFSAVLGNLPAPAPLQPVVDTKTADNDADDGFIFPGLFGTQKSRSEADKIMIEAERQLTLGNTQTAKTQAVKSLSISQDGGWSIWGTTPSRAHSILTEGETSAANVIRHYAPLLPAERYGPKWMQAQHLITRVGPLLTTTESYRVLDAVINHVRLMVGTATHEIESFNFLSDDTLDLIPQDELFRLIVWLCDHPQFLRRERAAGMLLWLLDQLPELICNVVKTAFSMDEGYGPDVLCGVLDGASIREPVVLWDKVMRAIDLAKVTKELRHVSRMAVLLRLAARAARSDSASATGALREIEKAFSGQPNPGEDLDIPHWANCLAEEWRQLEFLVGLAATSEWEKTLERLCVPLSVSDFQALEGAVARSFREQSENALGRWESKVRYALNLTLWAYTSAKVADKVETILRPYNPCHPERTVQGIDHSSPITEQLMAAISSQDYSAVLGSNAIVLLNYHDVAIDPKNDESHHVEVVCLLQPTSGRRGFFAPTLEQFFLSSELPTPVPATNPIETCCRLVPKEVFFGVFTPAVALPSFLSVTGAKESDLNRQNWRFSRRNDTRAFGRPTSEGCSLSISRSVLNIPTAFKLAWLISLDGEIVTLVDAQNNILI